MSNDYQRPTWDEYFMEIARAASKRGTCDRARVGCVIAKNKQILVTGYNGAPRGMPHCDEVGHQMKKITHEDGHTSEHCLRTAHAEQNAILQAAKIGVPLEGATVYCSMTPCATCAKMILNTGIKEIICEKRYHAGEESEEMFRLAGIDLKFFDDEIAKYERQ
jgi:dCMP deaminase